MSVREVSVIIPTYNRKPSLLRTLESLSRQSYPAERFEVIVVDDGSTDETPAVEQERTPFVLRYVRQANMGATAARNHGAQVSRGEALVFMDDDIAPLPGALECLVNELLCQPEAICLGKLLLPAELTDRSVYARMVQGNLRREAGGRYVSFEKCLTGFLAVRESDFRRIGMFQDPTGGWPNWDDVDFGYRASKAGFRLWYSADAVAEHWDGSAEELHVACDRWYRASKSAPQLFRKHPGLRDAVPMFLDKRPIRWREDPPRLVLRKTARQLISYRPVVRAMEWMAGPLERSAPESKLPVLLHRWIVSGYIFRGYREGLRDATAQNRVGEFDVRVE